MHIDIDILGHTLAYISYLFFQGNYSEMMTRYKQLLTYIKTAVTRNYSEKSINSILDYISTSKQVRGLILLCNKWWMDTVTSLPCAFYLYYGLYFPDGSATAFLWDNPGSSEGSQEWQTVVQDKHKARKTVLWPRRIHQVATHLEAVASVLSGFYPWEKIQFNICGFICTEILICLLENQDWWWWRWFEKRHPTSGNLCARNPNVYGTKEQQEVEGMQKD